MSEPWCVCASSLLPSPFADLWAGTVTRGTDDSEELWETGSAQLLAVRSERLLPPPAHTALHRPNEWHDLPLRWLTATMVMDSSCE